jgi:NTE family protein
MDILLALGGGGTKGSAHIGVLRVLEREGFKIRAIAGTSAGGIAATVYAAGHPPDFIEAYMSRVDHRTFFGLPVRGEPAIIGTQGIVKAIKELLGDRTFQDLRIPCAVTAVNLDTHQELVLREGRVLDAVMATIAIPGIFPPKKWGDHLLVDGGVLDPVPVSVVREISSDINLPVVAVTLTSTPTERGHLPALGSKAVEAVFTRIAHLKVAQAFEIFQHSIEIGMSAMTEMRFRIDQPDVIIRPDVRHIGYLDQVNVSEVVALGEIAAESVLPELRKSVSLRGRFRRWWRR